MTSLLPRRSEMNETHDCTVGQLPNGQWDKAATSSGRAVTNSSSGVMEASTAECHLGRAVPFAPVLPASSTSSCLSTEGRRLTSQCNVLTAWLLIGAPKRMGSHRETVHFCYIMTVYLLSHCCWQPPPPVFHNRKTASRLEQQCPVEPSAVMAAASHAWLLNVWDVTSVAEEANFQFYLMTI